MVAPAATIDLIGPDGFHITTLEEWRVHAKPKRGEFHWQPYRSAQENAKAWIGGAPSEIIRLLESHAATAGFTIKRAYPENIIRLDDCRGEQRNSDITVHACKDDESMVIDVEAKADESFGSSTIKSRLKASSVSKPQARKQNSGTPKRIGELITGVFGRKLDESIGGLRYQLLYSFAAAVIEAGRVGASRAVFIVHEFRSAGLNAKKLKANDDALNAFVRCISGWQQQIPTPGVMLPPIYLPGSTYIRTDIPISLGKVVTRLQ